MQFLLSLGIAVTVAIELGHPILNVRQRQPGDPTALMLMPKAAVDKDCFSARWEYQIGLSRQAAPMEAEAKTHPVHQAPDREFGRHPFVSNAAHVFAAPFSGNGVHGQQRDVVAVI